MYHIVGAPSLVLQAAVCLVSGVELLLRQAGQISEQLECCIRELPWAGVHQAQSPEATAIVVKNGKSRIEANARCADNQRIVGKSVVLKSVRHDHRLAAEHHVGAEG